MKKEKETRKIAFGTEKWVSVDTIEWYDGIPKMKCKNCGELMALHQVKHDAAQQRFLVQVGKYGLKCTECVQFLEGQIEEKKRRRMARVQLLKEIEDMEEKNGKEAEAEEVEMRKKLEDNQKLREEKLEHLKEILKNYPLEAES
jgi:hypothetical protein